MSAKKVFHTAMSGDRKFPIWVMKSRQDERLPAGAAQDVVLHEAAAEHEGLELQGRIEDPEEAEDDLQGPLGADGEGEAAVLRRRLRHSPSSCVPRSLSMPCFTLPAALGMAASGSHQGSSKSWAMQLVGVTASATGFPSTLS